jgi:hypothetical protein
VARSAGWPDRPGNTWGVGFRSPAWVSSLAALSCCPRRRIWETALRNQWKLGLGAQTRFTSQSATSMLAHRACLKSRGKDRRAKYYCVNSWSFKPNKFITFEDWWMTNQLYTPQFCSIRFYPINLTALVLFILCHSPKLGGAVLCQLEPFQSWWSLGSLRSHLVAHNLPKLHYYVKSSSFSWNLTTSCQSKSS